MPGIDRYGQTRSQRKGNDWVYGTGADGAVTISGTVTLTKDMHYSSLTVPLGNVLLTNGYRVFVTGTATINGVVGIGTVTGNVNNSSNGTITSPGAAVTTKTVPGTLSSAISYRLGGQGGGATNPNVSVLPSYLVNRIQSMTGVAFDATYGSSTPALLAGGSAGTTGSVGTTAAKKTNSDTWTGKAGGTGSNGNYSPNATTVNAPGGRGNTGNVGTATGTTDGTGGAGGAGGAGAGVVAIFAKTITGSGTIMSLGMSGSAGQSGQTGQAGTAGAGPTAYTSTTQRGTSGVDLNDGHQAPAIQHTNFQHHFFHHGHHTFHHGHHGTTHACNPWYDHSWGEHWHSHCNGHACCFFGHTCCYYDGHITQNADSHYSGGAGGSGGAAAPAVTGGDGKRGGAGGGGAVIIITETSPTSLNYDVRAGTTADADTFSASNGTAYIILNQ